MLSSVSLPCYTKEDGHLPEFRFECPKTPPITPKTPSYVPT